MKQSFCFCRPYDGCCLDLQFAMPRPHFTRLARYSKHERERKGERESERGGLQERERELKLRAFYLAIENIDFVEAFR